MKYFSRLGFILLAMCLFQSHNAFAGPFKITSPTTGNSDFSLVSQKQYTADALDDSLQAFEHFDTIVLSENIFNNGSHTVRITVENIPSGSSGKIIAVNKRISNLTGSDWDSIIIEVAAVNPSLNDPTVSGGGVSADALYIGGDTSSNTGTLDILGPGFEFKPQFTNDANVQTDINVINFENPSLFEITEVINLWFTLALPANVAFYQFDITQTFIGSNSIGGGPGEPGSTVPEPGILLLVGLGLLSTGIKRMKGLTREETPQMC